MRKGQIVIVTLVCVLSLVGCSSALESNTDELKEVTQVVNWFAQPAHGGQYAALAKSFYEEAGLDMEIEQGGPQVSPTQMVVSGQVEFGMTQGDDFLIAIDQGLPLVAVASITQVYPQAFAYHKGQGISDFSDLNGRTVWVTPGAAYWHYLTGQYDLDGVELMSHTGSSTSFIADETSVIQIYETIEPFDFAKEGIEIETLSIADSGYNPYMHVLITTEQFLNENPEQVEAFVQASVKGWNYYKENPDEINEILKEVNSDLNMESMKMQAEAQEDYIFTGDAETHGVGYMKIERWQTLHDQLLEAGVIENEIDVSKIFTSEYLPK